MNLRTMLLLAAERSPDSIVLADRERRVSYKDWATQVIKLADALVAEGVRHGDRVAFSMRNSIEFATALYATQMFGAVAVPFNFRLKPDTVNHIIKDSGARTLIFDDSITNTGLGTIIENNPEMKLIRSGAELRAGELSLQDLLEQGSERLHGEIDRLGVSGLLCICEMVHASLKGSMHDDLEGNSR